MYPNLYYVFRDLFGIEWPALKIVNSFGFFVALAFILAAVVIAAELRRKSKKGLLHPTEVQVMVGKPASAMDLALNFLLGFILGYKILAMFIMDRSVIDDPQAFIFSDRGNWPAGIILGLLFAGLKWWEKRKQVLEKPEMRKIRIWPQDRVGEITILALVFGLLGAKLFDAFENWNDFIKDPSSIFSARGLTWYGGLICAALAIWWYAKKHKIGFWHLNDAAAPALMLAYALGRIGCQVAGDGDWGILNSAYFFDSDSQKIEMVSDPDQFRRSLDRDSTYYANSFHVNNLDDVPRLHMKRPSSLSFLPRWVFAYDYPHNVNEAGVRLANCDDDKYCTRLPGPVFPTPFYETIICLLLFGIIWAIRKRFIVPGTLFSFYLILNGLERFFIEKIRVNVKMNFLGMVMTQAELISFLLVLTGIVMFIILKRKSKLKEK